MDHLAQSEAFLRAIFDAPDDETPRLVYADFLEEHGDPDRAAYIRLAIDCARAPEPQPDVQSKLDELCARHPAPWPWASPAGPRGFPLEDLIEVPADGLHFPDDVRAYAVVLRPHWFGAKSLRLTPPAIRPEHIETLFALPFTQQVREWDFGGHVEEIASESDAEDGDTFGLIDMVERPVITVAGVEALANLRAARRVTSLVLTHNNLDNDALRALVRSPYLENLKKLDVFEGNRFRGRTWQLALEKFGEHVVG